VEVYRTFFTPEGDRMANAETKISMFLSIMNNIGQTESKKKGRDKAFRLSLGRNDLNGEEEK
jgi:hypothetical protein